MPPYKHTAPSPAASAESTPRKRGRLARQDGATPKDSHLAGPSKRKASAALSDTSSSSQKKPKTTQPRGPKTDISGQSGRQVTVTEYDDKPYTVHVPAKQLKKNETSASSWGGKDGAQFGLETEYAIKSAQPGVPRWGDMRSYRTVKYQGLNFRIGDFAYFAKTLDDPEVVTDQETLASNDPLKQEREHNYIGMIAEARADDPKDVRLRIFYAYWPEELPQGRQPYHGMKEVIMSNHMDIMDAHTITSKVEVQQIDENVESVDGIYWRQTLDVTKYDGKPKKGQAPGVLSKLKAHCRCDQPSNPDKTVFICQKCKAWNHEECLVDAVLERAWKKHEVGTLGKGDEIDHVHFKGEEEETIEVAPRKSPVLGMMRSAVNAVFGSASPARPAPSPEVDSDATAVNIAQVDGPAEGRAIKKVKKEVINTRMPGEVAPWDGIYSAAIDTTGKYGKADVVIAQVVDEATGEAVWTTAATCFNCGKRLD